MTSNNTDCRRCLDVLISGGSLSGNKGAMAMTLVLAQEIRKMFPDCRLRLLSKSFDRDFPAATRQNIELVKAPAGKIATTTLARSFMAMMLGPFCSKWFYDGIMQAYDKADILIDIGGVTFSDDRDWRGLLLSIGWLTPALAVHTPIAKISQAMGPFNKKANRLFARFLLKRCGLLIARGRESFRNISTLLGSDKDCNICADVAFLLKPASSESVDAFLKKNNLPRRDFVGVSPSAVIDRKARSGHGRAQYRSAMAGLIQHIRETAEVPVMLIPHAWPQASGGSEDMELCCELVNDLPDQEKIFVIEEELDAPMLKGIIACSQAFIACRFHAMIAALSSEVPTLVVGWGYKYHEVMEVFGIERFCFDFGSVDEGDLAGHFTELWQNRGLIQKKLYNNLSKVEESSMGNFRLLRLFLEENGLI